MDLRRMSFFRYVTENPEPDAEPIRTFVKVAKLMHLPVTTIFNAIRRYKKDGLRFVERRKLNFQKVWRRNLKITGPVKDLLLSFDVLNDWAPLNLDQRVKLLHQKGLCVAAHTLSAFYRRHGITYRVVKY